MERQTLQRRTAVSRLVGWATIKQSRLLAAVLASLLLVPVAAPAAATHQSAETLTLDDASPADWFGGVVDATSGAIAAGTSHRGPQQQPGVHIFEPSATLGWVEVARFTQPAPLFGSSLALDGDWLAVAGTDDGNPLCGRVHLYQRNGIWANAGSVERDPCSDDIRFGTDLALSGARLAVSDGDAVHLYDEVADAWGFRTTIAFDEPVWEIALGGDLLTVLWQGTEVGDPVTVSVFELGEDPIGEPKLIQPELHGITPHCRDVAVDVTTIVVGCPEEQIFGAAFVYDLVGDEWVETAELLPRNASADFNFFGHAVAVDGDEVLVGAPGWTEEPLVFIGSGYLFRLIEGSWHLVATYPGQAPGGSLGSLGTALDLEGGLVALGDPEFFGRGMVALHQAPKGRFGDDEHTVHQNDIDAIAAAGVARGCNPPLNSEFCPNDAVTRAQMAAFLRRALDLPVPAIDVFTDDDGSIFEDDINAIAEAGITLGCNPPLNDRYCPDRVVTRETMAAFIRRGFGYAAIANDAFTDDDGSIFEDDINAIAGAGITLGCNPPSNDRYCPNHPVTRAQMASFLARALATMGR